ncbi:MAG: hypothetical protein IT450_01540 [Phycisphaerales bacterium]|nr:hypothetical protein [Phycisphaerales bacterium]
MSDASASTPATSEEAQSDQINAAGPEFQVLIENAAAQGAFGPVFFLTQLVAFLRDHCADAAEALPSVEIRLHSGENLEICHIIGVDPLYVALAVFDDAEAGGPRAMRTELLPYTAIARVTIRAARPAGPKMGFRVTPVSPLQAVKVLTPEQALRLAAAAPAAQAHRADRKNV